MVIESFAPSMYYWLWHLYKVGALQVILDQLTGTTLTLLVRHDRRNPRGNNIDHEVNSHYIKLHFLHKLLKLYFQEMLRG